MTARSINAPPGGSSKRSAPKSGTPWWPATACCLRPEGTAEPREGLITRVEPRHGTISRAVRGRRQVLVSNVDQLLIISSVAEPRLKPNLLDRMLAAAEKGRVRPVICINKVDLDEPANLQPLVGVYSRMGYTVLLISAKTGFGMDRLQQLIAGRSSVVAGQSGVGKSSLLNAIDAGLHLRVGKVSEENEKGRHTTTDGFRALADLLWWIRCRYAGRAEL